MGNGSITKCCKKPNIVVAAVSVEHITTATKKKITPYGYGRLYAGARTNDNRYTSPILALHTWTKSLDVDRGRTAALIKGDGHNSSWFDKNQPNTVLSDAAVRHEAKMGLDENIQIIPVEDIISINAECEVKRAVASEKRRRIRTPPPEDLSCCQQMKKSCIRKVCCLCCKEKQVAPEFVETESQSQQAARCILVTINHLRHGNVDTPSNVRVLSTVKQAEFYDKQLAVDTVKFYYFQDETIDEHQYKMKLQESETLARIIMQLKGMNGQYPDSPQLDQLIKQQEILPFGYESNENLPVLSGSFQRTTAIATTNQDA